MLEVVVNGLKVQVENSYTVLQACQKVGIEIPRFCYHERLSIAGNCRMCLVEVEKSVKPVASCAMPVMPGMVIKTNTVMVKKAREGVMELLLANHPLDCPICDQGGECDLQDEAVVYGNDRGRFYEYKRAVMDKNCGPLIKTVMTRCIHCTRCVRFSEEVAGVGDFGVTGRGNSMEIGMYVDRVFLSEISGNIIDLCPVGALTSKPYAFTARSWELKKVESIDCFDAMGSSLSICVRGSSIMRILPIVNEAVNEEWLTDKARFAYDGLKRQRILQPMIRTQSGLEVVSWEVAFSQLIRKVFEKEYNFVGVVGNMVELESLVLMKDLFYKLGGSCVGLVPNKANSSADFTQNYIVNSKIAGVEQSDLCLLLGVNMRLELPLVLARMRRKQRRDNLLVASIGPTVEYYCDVRHIGNSGQEILKFIEGRLYFCAQFVKAKNPLVYIGLQNLPEETVKSIRYGFSTIESLSHVNREDWCGLNYITTGANSVGQLHAGIQYIGDYVGKKDITVYYIVGSDEIEINKGKDDIVIYQGHHGDQIVKYADIVLPGVTVVEKEGLYINVEGRVQKNKFVFYPGGNARGDWQILRSLFEILLIDGIKLDNLSLVRGRLLEQMAYSLNKVYVTGLNVNLFKEKGKVSKIIYSSYIHNYYQTDSITRASKVMALCSKKLEKYRVNYRISF